jgi:acyl-CoA thioesterase-1
MLALDAGAASASPGPTVVERTIEASADGPVVVTIGDSIMEGHGLDPTQAWPALLAERDGWRLTNLASDGSGFAMAGNNRDTFADQVAVAARLHPDIVIIGGSSNDLGVNAATLAKATTDAIKKLRVELPNADIIALSAVWGNTAVPAQISSINADVDAAAVSVEATYLNIGQPLSNKADLMQGDDVHPTADGQRDLAAAISRAMADTDAIPDAPLVHYAR